MGSEVAVGGGDSVDREPNRVVGVGGSGIVVFKKESGVVGGGVGGDFGGWGDVVGKPELWFERLFWRMG